MDVAGRQRIIRAWRTASAGIALTLLVGVEVENVCAQATSADTLRRDVAKVRIEREGVTGETAAALPVGWSDTRLYLVTVFHAVAPIESNGVEHKVTAIRVELANDPEVHAAQMFPRFDSALDLAVVSIDLPSKWVQLATLSTGSVRASQAVTLIGHPAAGDWSVWSGQIQNENDGFNVARFVYAGSKEPVDGYSGGPIFGSDGSLLGIHSGTPGTPGYGVGTKVRDIVRLLSAWRVPTNRFRDSTPDQVYLCQSGCETRLADLVSRHECQESTVGVTVTQTVCDHAFELPSGWPISRYIHVALARMSSNISGPIQSAWSVRSISFSESSSFMADDHRILLFAGLLPTASTSFLMNGTAWTVQISGLGGDDPGRISIRVWPSSRGAR
jgi:hypothetical protein